MFASSAPYVVTIFVTVITWVLSTYYEDVSTAQYLKHEIIDDGRTASPPYVTYRFSNIAAQTRITDVKVGLDCKGVTACFVPSNATGGSYAEMLRVAPWGMESKLVRSALIVTEEVDLPPLTAFDLKVSLVDGDRLPTIFFSLSDDEIRKFNFVQSGTFSLFLANNFICVVSLVLLVAGLLLAVIYRQTRNREGEGTSETVNIRIIERVQ